MRFGTSSAVGSLLAGFAVLVAACGDEHAVPESTPTQPGAVRASQTLIDFGDVSCGESNDSSVTLENTWARDDIAFTAAAQPAELFEVVDATGVATANAATRLRIRAHVTGAPAGSPLAGVLHIQLAAPHAGEISVPLRVTPHGAMLEVVGAPGLDFGIVPLAAPTALLPLQLRNAGDRDIDVGFAVLGSLSFATSTAAPTTVHAHGEASVTMSFRPRAAGDESGTIQLSTTQPLCNAVPARVPLKATASAGALGVAPGAIDFGDSPCGSAPGERTLTLTNYGATSLRWDAHVLESELFALTSASSGSLGTDESVNLGIAPLATDMTPGPMTGHLVITSGDQAVAVPVTRTKLGGVIEVVTAMPASLGRVKVGTSAAVDVQLRNRGSTPVTITPALDAATEMSLTSAAPISVLPGSAATISVTYTPTTLPFSEHVETVAVSTTDTLCAAMPSPSVRGVAFARAVAAWGETSVLLDDGVRFADLRSRSTTIPTHLLPSDAVPIMHPMAGRSCYTQPGVVGLTCWDHATLTLYPELDGMVDLDVGYGTGLLADGTLVSLPSRTAIPSLTGIARLRGFDSLACAIRQTGTAACWGGGWPTYSSFGVDSVVVTAPFEVPGLDDAVDMAMGPFESCTCFLRRGGTLSCWGDPDAYAPLLRTDVVLPSPIVKLIGQSDRQRADSPLMLTASKEMYRWWGPRSNQGALKQADDVRDVVASCDGSQACAILTDGRIVYPTLYPGGPIQPYAGFD